MLNILEDNEYILQRGSVGRTLRTFAYIFLILTIAAAVVFCLLFLGLVSIASEPFLPTAIRDIFKFTTDDYAIISICLTCLFALVSFVFAVCQLIKNKRNFLIITNRRFLVKVSGKKMFALSYKEIDNVNLIKGNLELTCGSTLYNVRHISNATPVHLLAAWYLSNAKGTGRFQPRTN